MKRVVIRMIKVPETRKLMLQTENSRFWFCLYIWKICRIWLFESFTISGYYFLNLPILTSLMDLSANFLWSWMSCASMYSADWSGINSCEAFFSIGYLDILASDSFFLTLLLTINAFLYSSTLNYSLRMLATGLFEGDKSLESSELVSFLFGFEISIWILASKLIFLV